MSNKNQQLSNEQWQEMLNWMKNYMKSFYSADQSIQEGILIKEKHTMQVVKIAEQLADHLKLNQHDTLLAKIIALFHDVGRFHQFAVYRTFNDAASENHALLGIQVMQNLACIQALSEQERRLIKFAVKNHNAKQIEITDDKKALYFAKFIRDADKLDIFRVLRPYLTQNDLEPCSDEFIRQFQTGGQCDYRKMRTQNDRKLVRLLWLYDVNFTWTLQKIVNHGYVDEIINSLPQTDDMQKGFTVLHNYIETKLMQSDSSLADYCGFCGS